MSWGLQPYEIMSLLYDYAQGQIVNKHVKIPDQRNFADNRDSRGSDSHAASVITLLAEKGILDEPAIARLERAMATASESPIILLQQLGLAKEDDVLAAVASVANIGIASSGKLTAFKNAEFPISLKFLQNARIAPLEKTDHGVAIAMANPFDDAAAAAISYQLELPVIRFAASLSAIEAALSGIQSGTTIGDARIVSGAASSGDLEVLQDLASGAPVIRFVSSVIEKASTLGASDIHFEPTEELLRIRLRVDGSLHDIEPAPFSMRLAILSRLKVLAKLDIAESRLPQDGRAKIAIRGSDIDLRVSTTPTIYGESIVIRLLDRTSVELDLPSLGFSPENQLAIKSILNCPNGLALVTGPTGSGKTTTLYAALRALNDPRRKIFSVEDPVEYRLQGVNQVQANPKIGLTFATALRSLLRQDPDIMMVGEIRDSETAEIAVQAALTGHLVLATIHTNSAAATVTRLLDMGIDDYLISASVIGIVAQRLVGVLCPHCAEATPAPEAILRRFNIEPVPGMTVKRPVGCPQCRGVGFAGRTTIAEVLKLSPEIEDAIIRRKGSAEIERLAIRAGMITMAKDGLNKALQGVTSVEEVLRAVKA